MARKLISGLVFLLVLGVVGAGVYYGVTHVSSEPSISAEPDEAIQGARSEAISLPEVHPAGEAVTKIDIGGGRALQMTEGGKWDIMDVQRVTAMLSSLSNPKLSRLDVGSGYELVLTQSGWQMWAIKEYRAQRQGELTRIDIGSGYTLERTQADWGLYSSNAPQKWLGSPGLQRIDLGNGYWLVKRGYDWEMATEKAVTPKLSAPLEVNVGCGYLLVCQGSQCDLVQSAP